ncbi:MAG TPA: ribulose-phosphate 3-epimerase [Steroidobacteraceae bacterium]|nr:ribulose-phosphate 3-epimerase [Steroidobacteraceae bacterium]
MRQSPLVQQLRASAPQVSVGVLTADWMSLGSQLGCLESAGVNLLHFDVMDGCFCPALTLGAPVIGALKTSLLKDVHLMIEDPLSKLEGFVAAGADIITIHAEATRHAHRVLQILGQMRNANDPNRGIVRGIALNPSTPLELLDPLLDELDLVLLLAVNPGWSGQRFIASTGERLARLKRQLNDRVLVGVDGGITRGNIGEVARMGADIIVTGSAVFDGRSPLENARHMIDAVR